MSIYIQTMHTCECMGFLDLKELSALLSNQCISLDDFINFVALSNISMALPYVPMRLKNLVSFSGLHFIYQISFCVVYLYFDPQSTNYIKNEKACSIRKVYRK